MHWLNMAICLPPNKQDESPGTESVASDLAASFQFDKDRALKLTKEHSTGNDVPNLELMIAKPTTLMELVIGKYNAENRSRFRGRRRRSRDNAQQQSSTQRHNTQQWLDALYEVDFDSLPQSGKIDYILLRNRLQYNAANANRRNGQREAANAVDESGIRGRPIGREQLIRELQREMIPYAPDQLIEIAMKEYQWCQEELKKSDQGNGLWGRLRWSG